MKLSINPWKRQYIIRKYRDQLFQQKCQFSGWDIWESELDGLLDRLAIETTFARSNSASVNCRKIEFNHEKIWE